MDQHLRVVAAAAYSTAYPDHLQGQESDDDYQYYGKVWIQLKSGLTLMVSADDQGKLWIQLSDDHHGKLIMDPYLCFLSTRSIIDPIFMHNPVGLATSGSFSFVEHQ
ncbi:hypothetical protein FH972_009786 [Carpinus fangiana]|uniref:Uncharacterized protein n=1 Tax=Carpinus fangiana TaxID=176857 RepID=A0A660KMY5_9ROSI|nr:hypothetical protein FH972_009786 [Carpinus fangiana]